MRQDVLYVCDAAGSAIRAVYLRDQRVQTLVGQGPYDFGSVDGPRSIVIREAFNRMVVQMAVLYRLLRG